MKLHSKVLIDHEMAIVDEKHKVATDYTAGWRNIFPNFGMCMTSEKSSHGYVPIPRCGSQYWLDFCANYLGYNPVHIRTLLNNCDRKNFFVIVRDPYQRYLSALWATSKYLNEDILSQIYENPSLDDHHNILQKDYLYRFDLSQIDFFTMDDTEFTRKIFYYLEKYCGYKSKRMSKWHSSVDKTEVKSLVESDAKVYNRIREYLHDDYTFIQSIKFYNYE